MLYLAGPYSHENPDVREIRARLHSQAAASLLQQGFHPYSPIAHWHEIAIIHNLPTDAGFWHSHNRAILAKSSHLVVLQIAGWEASTGLRAEIAFADDCSIPATMLTMEQIPNAKEYIPSRARPANFLEK